MAYKHGVYTGEQATSLVPMTQTDSGLIVAFGTAPVHLASYPAEVNTPVLCYTHKEAVAAFGYSDDWGKYSLSEVVKTHFAYFNMAPIVLINVLDPATHKTAVVGSEKQITDGVVKVADPVLIPSLKVSLTADGDPLVIDTDYTAAYEGETLYSAV